MEHKERIERLFSDTPAPCVHEGCHRVHLKAEIMESMRRKDKKMMNWQKRTAWACGLILTLVVTAWAGEKLYKVYITEHQRTIDFETSHTFNKGDLEKINPVKNGTHISRIDNVNGSISYKEDGSLTIKGKTTFTSADVQSNGAVLTEAERVKMADEAIARLQSGAGELIRVEDAQNGSKTYVYKVTMQDGKEIEYRSKIDMKVVKPETVFADVIRNKDGTVSISQWVLQDRTAVRADLPDDSKWNKELLAEIPVLIEQGKGKLTKVERLKDGRFFFVYSVTLSNGKNVKYGSFDKPTKAK